ncbi:MAG: hypothetical protein WAZ20_01840 [Methanothrix sp.]|jgi:hypothetical protein|uniref:hypothetical protein n=1 Tax=Methanothrix sp. TaxID=90426 RepID=UPI002B6C8F15|nr:hypothetical protein [Methanothrix sp.]
MVKDRRLPRIKKHILAGKEIQAGDRAIHPIIEVLVMAAGDDLLGFRSRPIALLIIEPGGEYAFSLEGEQMAVDEIYRLASSLKDIGQCPPTEQ